MAGRFVTLMRLMSAPLCVDTFQDITRFRELEDDYVLVDVDWEAASEFGLRELASRTLRRKKTNQKVAAMYVYAPRMFQEVRVCDRALELSKMILRTGSRIAGFVRR